MSRLISVELEGFFFEKASIETVIKFFEQNNITYIYDEKIAVNFYKNNTNISDFDYLDKSALNNQKINIIGILSSFYIDNEYYSLNFFPVSSTKLSISFGSTKKIDEYFTDFNWIYNNFLKKINNELFNFHSIIYEDLDSQYDDL